MANKEWKESMGEISGFGGSYEDTCRKMLFRGLEWMDANPDAKLKFGEFKDVFGLVVPENDKSVELEDYIIKDLDCTGAMVHAVTQHLMFIRTHSWDEYVKELEEREDE